MIAQIRLHSALGQLQNQGKAWQYLANTLEYPALDDVLTRTMRYRWYRNMLAIREVYTNLDPRTPYELAVNASDVSSKYVLAYCASFAVNGVLGNAVLSGGTVSDDQKELAKQVVALADEVYRDARVSKVVNNGKSYDFLRMAIASVQHNLKGLDKNSPTTSSSRPSSQ